MPPEPLDAAILFAPVGDLVRPALESLDRGGTLSIAGIYLSDIPPLNYARHLFQERQIRSVANMTRQDARDFLELAGKIKLRPRVTVFPLEQANEALAALKADRINGSVVVVP